MKVIFQILLIFSISKDNFYIKVLLYLYLYAKYQRKINVVDKTKDNVVVWCIFLTFFLLAVETKHMQTQQDPNLIIHNITDDCILPSCHWDIWKQSLAS